MDDKSPQPEPDHKKSAPRKTIFLLSIVIVFIMGIILFLIKSKTGTTNNYANPFSSQKTYQNPFTSPTTTYQNPFSASQNQQPNKPYQNPFAGGK